MALLPYCAASSFRITRFANHRSLVCCLLVAGVGLYVAGCALSVAPGDFGATVGGQQDIAAGRDAIENGFIPDPASITVQGFMSEHNIPLDAPENPGLVFASATTAWHHDFDAFTPFATLVLGMGTTVDMETFTRPPLNLCIVIDQSGSMRDTIDARSGATKLDAVKIAIDRMLGRLTGNDLVSIVTFDTNATLVLDAAAGDDIAAIKAATATIEPEGGTRLANGMRRGYRAVRNNASRERSDRVIVFTDAELRFRQETAARDFIDTMEEFAAEGIGGTLFGVGTSFGHEIAFDIAQVRGGNYFFLNDYDRIVSVFDEEFDTLVTPIAYDITLDIDVPPSLDVVEVHGVPIEGPFSNRVSVTIPSLFLSKRAGGGAIMVRLRGGALVDFNEAITLADVTLSYVTPGGTTETQPIFSAVLPAGLDPSAEPDYFASPAAQRAVLLLNTAIVLQRTGEDAGGDFWRYNFDRPRAIDRLTDFLPYFDAMAAGLEDRTATTSRALSEERTLLSQLLDNLQ